MAAQPDFSELDKFRSVEELANLQASTQREVQALDSEYAGQVMPDTVLEAFDAASALYDEIGKRLTHLNQRKERVSKMVGDEGKTEAPTIIRSPDPVDIWDTRRLAAQAYSEPDKAEAAARDQAMRAVEVSRFPHISNQAEARDHVSNLLETVEDPPVLARRILNTGSPVYGRAFGKMLQGAFLNSEEQRALSLTSASGGYAVPITIDPTVIPTSNSSVNPLRAISRIEKIVGDEWRGVSSGAVTVAYAAEATETTDNAPTLAQPVISTEKAQAFIPFSIEIGMDWSGMQASMAMLLQEGKDDLEADKFFTGTGTNEPFGVLVGATNTVNATTGQTFDAEDLYRLEAALPPRYRARASFVANRAIYNLIRQFVLTGQSNPWKDLEQATTVDGRVGNLLGYPAYEASGMTGTTATAVKFLLLGDFNRFVIVDRIGLDIEVIPHLVGTNHRPTGQRGLYAYFRNSSKVVDANAFRLMIGLA